MNITDEKEILIEKRRKSFRQSFYQFLFCIFFLKYYQPLKQVDREQVNRRVAVQYLK